MRYVSCPYVLSRHLPFLSPFSPSSLSSSTLTTNAPQVHTSAPVSQLAALKASARALTHASRAFFNPGMLALLYFPAEHTYAVYTPLFASIAAPLVGAVVRELSAWRKARRGAAAAQAQAQG